MHKNTITVWNILALKLSFGNCDESIGKIAFGSEELHLLYIGNDPLSFRFSEHCCFGIYYISQNGVSNMNCTFLAPIGNFKLTIDLKSTSCQKA